MAVISRFIGRTARGTLANLIPGFTSYTNVREILEAIAAGGSWVGPKSGAKPPNDAPAETVDYDGQPYRDTVSEQLWEGNASTGIWYPTSP